MASPSSADIKSPSADHIKSPPIRWRRVRVIGKEVSINKFGDVSKDKEIVKNERFTKSYSLDHLYDQYATVSTMLREIRTLIRGIFEGEDASVVVLGARGSGKNLLIEGSVDEPGLLPRAVSEILSFCEKGVKQIIKMSSYEIHQETMIDLLDDGRKEVQISEDAHSALQGLSRVSLKSTLDLNELYFSRRKQHKLTKKEKSDVTSMARGITVYLYPAAQSESEINVTARINFIVLAGSDDIEEKSNILEVGTARRNTPEYVLQNVISALNASGIHVPYYRGSKVTQFLKDLLSKENCRTLIITCLVQKVEPSGSELFDKLFPYKIEFHPARDPISYSYGQWNLFTVNSDPSASNLAPDTWIETLKCDDDYIEPVVPPTWFDDKYYYVYEEDEAGDGDKDSDFLYDEISSFDRIYRELHGEDFVEYECGYEYGDEDGNIDGDEKNETEKYKGDDDGAEKETKMETEEKETGKDKGEGHGNGDADEIMK